MSKVGQHEEISMTYEYFKSLKTNAFKRRCGVHRETFDKMVNVLRPHLERKGKRGGQCKLSVENQLLITLEYWREYRTLFHIASSWGVSESTVCRLVKKVENHLMESGEFRLPGKKQVYQNAYGWKVLVVDVAETPIERPKKNSDATIVARKSGTR